MGRKKKESKVDGNDMKGQLAQVEAGITTGAEVRITKMANKWLIGDDEQEIERMDQLLRWKDVKTGEWSYGEISYNDARQFRTRRLSKEQFDQKEVKDGDEASQS